MTVRWQRRPPGSIRAASVSVADMATSGVQGTARARGFAGHPIATV